MNSFAIGIICGLVIGGFLGVAAVSHPNAAPEAPDCVVAIQTVTSQCVKEMNSITDNCLDGIKKIEKGNR